MKTNKMNINKSIDKLRNKIFLNFCIKILLILALMCLFFAVIHIVIKVFNFQWFYDFFPTCYKFLKNAFYGGDNLPLILFLLFLLILIIVLIIVYDTLKKVFNYFSLIIIFSRSLFDKNNDIVDFPIELEDIQKELDLIKITFEKNELIAEDNKKRKDDLIAYLAHDLKTPLTSMIGYLSLIDEIEDMPERQRTKYIKIALDKSYKLEELINELFDIARFNNDDLILEYTDIDLLLMMNQIVDDFYPILKDNGKKIKLKACKTVLEGDSDKLYRVFNNLIKNSINYSIDSTIYINVESSNENAVISIKNKSKRISNDSLNKIFEKFFRIDSSRNSKTGGSGLGLAIAKDIVEKHNGTISANYKDGYITFIVKLPIHSLSNN